ncbi:MAG: XisI protein [Kamptonema sp. SIO4C4]|nr:XisI protein [Kamptonema sp. SIO4C4]
MAKLEQYRKSIIHILQKHAQCKPSHGDIEPLFISDINTDNYLLLDTGWAKTGRVHAVVLHLRIVGEKIWIESDGTEDGIALELLALDIPKEDIVLGFMRPQRRHLTDFAMA